MRQTFSLGRIFGIRIGVNWSVLVIVALLAYGLAVGQFPAEVPHRPEGEYVVAAVLTALVYMASLLAHELAHSLVARRNGVQVEDITLWLLGGVSRLEGEFPDPGAELRVAGADRSAACCSADCSRCWPGRPGQAAARRCWSPRSPGSAASTSCWRCST